MIIGNSELPRAALWIALIACMTSPGLAQTTTPPSTTPAPAATSPAAATPAPAAPATTPPATPPPVATAPSPTAPAAAGGGAAANRPKVQDDCVGDSKFRTTSGAFRYPLGPPIVPTTYFLPAGATTDL